MSGLNERRQTLSEQVEDVHTAVNADDDQQETPTGAADMNQGSEQGSDGLEAHDEGPSGTSTDVGTDAGTEEGEDGNERSKKRKVLDEAKLMRLKEDMQKRGVVYVSRIPGHMKPMKLKQLLSQYGETLRVYCTPEDPKARKMRKKKGGDKGKKFTEGWVEFADKRIAKRVALMLNGKKIGGKRRSAYFDDLWNIKYLKHFKWDHLTEEIAYQKAVREQRLAAEIRAAKADRDDYLAQVDRAKAAAAIAARRQGKAAQDKTTGDAAAQPSAAAADTAKTSAGAGSGAATGQALAKNRHIGQRQPVPVSLAVPGVPAAAAPAAGSNREMSDDVLMLLARNKKRKTTAS